MAAKNMFLKTTPASVLALLFALLLCSACNEAPQGPAQPSSEPALINVTWILQSAHVGDSSVAVSGSDYTLRFSDSGSVQVRLACNHLYGSFQATLSTVKLTDGIETLVACNEDPYSELVKAVISQEPSQYLIADSTLCLSSGNRKACFRPG